MEVKLQKKGDLGREMTITVPAGEVARMVNDRLERIGREAKIPGFRPGKIPANVLKQRYGAQVEQEVSQDLVSETMPKAFDKEKVMPAAQPKVEFGNYAEGKDYTYTISFEVLPEFKPKGYTEAKLTRQTSEASDKQITEALDRLSQSMRSFETKKGKAAKGDLTIITATGYDAKSGDALEGATISKHSVELGSGALIPGFEDALIGHEASDKAFDIEVTFPKDYHAKALAGVKARFNVELHEVKKASLPKIDDQFATQFGAKDLADLKSKISDQLKKDIDEASRQRLKRDLFDHLEKENKFALPDSMVDQEFQSIWRALMQDMQRAQVSFDQLDKSEDEMRAEHRKLAERRVRVGLVLAEIGKVEKINVSGDEIQAEVERIASQFPGEQADRARQYYNSERGRQEVFGPLFENKVCDWIFEKAKITDKKVDADEILKELNN